jgi:hypothetical protein
MDLNPEGSGNLRAGLIYEIVIKTLESLRLMKNLAFPLKIVCPSRTAPLPMAASNLACVPRASTHLLAHASLRSRAQLKEGSTQGFFPAACQTSVSSVILALMAIDTILSQIDQEIARLRQARALLTSLGSGAARATGSKAKRAAAKPRRKRVLSAEARKRIADAQRKRWAAQRAKSKSK